MIVVMMPFFLFGLYEKNGEPLEKSEELEKIYNEHMTFLFKEYENFVDAGIPKEDARFLLPYCYRSNFYCTVNARELGNILYAMLYGRGSRHTELKALGEELLKQAAEICPFIFEDLSAAKNAEDNKYDRIAEIAGKIYCKDAKNAAADCAAEKSEGEAKQNPAKEVGDIGTNAAGAGVGCVSQGLAAYPKRRQIFRWSCWSIQSSRKRQLREQL